MKEKPDTPPSAVAAVPASELSFCTSFKELWANKNFLRLVLNYAVIYGVSCGIGASLSNLLNPFGFSPSQISMIGGCCLVAGVTAALVVGSVLDHTASYKKTHIALSFLVFAAVILIIVVLQTSDGNLVGMILATTFLGISFVSLFPASLSYGAELTFPLQAGLVNACMNFSGQILAFLFTALTVWITDIDASDESYVTDQDIQSRKNHSFTTLYVIAGSTFLAFVLAIFIKEDLRRVNYKVDISGDQITDKTT